MSNLFGDLANLLDLVITIYMWLVIIRVILSWLSVDSYNPFVQFIIRVTEPALSKIRGIVPNFAERRKVSVPLLEEGLSERTYES